MFRHRRKNSWVRLFESPHINVNGICFVGTRRIGRLAHSSFLAQGWIGRRLDIAVANRLSSLGGGGRLKGSQLRRISETALTNHGCDLLRHRSFRLLRRAAARTNEAGNQVFPLPIHVFTCESQPPNGITVTLLEPMPLMKWSLKLSTNLEKKSAPNAVEGGGVANVGG